MPWLKTYPFFSSLFQPQINWGGWLSYFAQNRNHQHLKINQSVPDYDIVTLLLMVFFTLVGPSGSWWISWGWTTPEPSSDHQHHLEKVITFPSNYWLSKVFLPWFGTHVSKLVMTSNRDFLTLFGWNPHINPTNPKTWSTTTPESDYADSPEKKTKTLDGHFFGKSSVLDLLNFFGLTHRFWTSFFPFSRVSHGWTIWTMLHEAKKYECHSVRIVFFWLGVISLNLDVGFNQRKILFASCWDALSHIKFYGCAIATGIRWQYLGLRMQPSINFLEKDHWCSVLLTKSLL